MRSSFSKYFRNSLGWIFLLLFLTLPTFYLLLRPGYFTMQDDIQAFRVFEMDKCFKDLQIPCRWVPDMGFGFGYPQFEFYPPTPYYLGEIFHLLGFQFIDTVKILFVLGFIASAVAMFIFLRSIFDKWPAFIGALLYSFIPYKAMQVYVRGALSEFLSFILFPLIFWSSYKLIKSAEKKYILWLALFLGLLLTVHNLMSFIFLPLVLVWSLLWIYLEKAGKLGLKVAAGILLGFGLAAFFILPLIFERDYVHLDSILSGYFDYRQHFVSLEQLFFSNHFGYGSSAFGSNDDLSLSTGVVHWMVGLLAVILAVVSFKKNRKISIMVLTLAGIELLILFLMHQKSSFIWEEISLLAWLQFPWRFLSASVFLLSVLGSAAVFFIWVRNKKLSVVLGVGLIVSLYVVHLNFFKPLDWLDISDKDKFSGESWEKQLTISIFDYLPIYAKFPPNRSAPDQPEILEGKVEIKKYYKGSNYQRAEALISEEAILRLPLFDFPGMVVQANGQVIDHQNNDCRNQPYCFGLISFKLDPGQYYLEARLTNTPVRWIGNVLTMLSTAILLIMLRKKPKHG